MHKTLVGAMMVMGAVTAQAREVKTVTWFLDHPAERRAVIAYCADSPGEAWRDANCMNADAARDKAAALRVINSGRR